MPFILGFFFFLIPLLELAILIQVGQQIGVGPTIVLLILMSILGGFLAKREGLAVWKRFRATLARGEVPSTELIDGVLVLFGAALLLTPGFLTDVMGIALLIPASRAAVRRVVMKSGGWLVAKRFPFLIPLGLVRNRTRKVRAHTVVTEPVEPVEGEWRDAADRDHLTGP
ncbi:MAG TPA: FxsA family protein [Actinomycetota bacterium]|jgi:UPF0716 protein FxsA|nr:FxsA family protein [Actinomycetota bacterium]